MSTHPHAQIAVKAVRAEGTLPATAVTASERLCELCFRAPARDRAPNLTGHQLGPPVCRRCGAKIREFTLCAKALEGILLEKRQLRRNYVLTAPTAPHAAPTRTKLGASGVPTEDRILRGLVTLNAAWRYSIVARAGAPVTPTFCRADLTGLYSSLRAYKRSRRMMDVLASSGVLDKFEYHPNEANALRANTVPPTNRGHLYTLGRSTPMEIESLLRVCRTLHVDAAGVLGEHLVSALQSASTNDSQCGQGLIQQAL